MITKVPADALEPSLSSASKIEPSFFSSVTQAEKYLDKAPAQSIP